MATSASLKERVTSSQSAKKVRLTSAKALEASAKRKPVPDATRLATLHPLAAQWLHNETIPADIRRYLVEHIFPTLMGSLGKVLGDVERRGLLDKDNMAGSGYNPLTRLAQYLVRSNPHAAPRAAPATEYAASLKIVQDALNTAVADLEAERELKLQREVVRRRSSAAALFDDEVEAAKPRLAAILAEVPKWRVPGTDNQHDVAKFHAALRSFVPVGLRLTDEEKARLTFHMLPSDVPSGKLVDERSTIVQLCMLSVPLGDACLRQLCAHLVATMAVNAAAVVEEVEVAVVDESIADDAVESVAVDNVPPSTVDIDESDAIVDSEPSPPAPPPAVGHNGDNDNDNDNDGVEDAVPHAIEDEMTQ